ncbi:MAG: cation-translocating P-type ATPase [Oceanospirillaceae bacterium]|nr:cation-translocating P-type ATPase [Oceanospirillaceae bacterium]
MSPKPPHHWHCLDTGEALARLDSAATGLNAGDAGSRLARTGPNRLQAARQKSALHAFVGQFGDLMILVLLAAAAISGLVGELRDALVILIIVLLNGLVGAVQEYRAERALAVLRRMASPDALVLRDGRAQRIDAEQLVPGDIVLVEAGNLVPADLRLIESESLAVDESALTGESEAVDKDIETLDDPSLPVGDRRNQLFRSSLVSRGRGRGLVVATGMDTEIGRIAGLLGREQRVKTPLQQRLTRFGRYLALVVLAICALIFAAGLLRGEAVLLMFLTAVSLAVAAIPEALPAVVTVSLAFGARKLGRRHALVRKLPAVETLGAVTFICTDKTGTLTLNRMTAERFWGAGELRDDLPAEGEPWQSLGRVLALNNDISLEGEEPTGEATELALFEAAQRAGFERTRLESQYPRIGALPFSSERQQMTTLHCLDDGVLACVKGAPERVLPQCSDALGTDFDQAAVLQQAEALASEGYRVLALAQRRFDQLPTEPAAETVERQLSFIGLVALIDPPRPEVAQAVDECRRAGITPVMITGDHPATALAIARRLGICGEDDEAMTGAELGQLSREALAGQVEQLRVYARVSPEQKIRIVRALQAHGEFVAMTGDGINDAPALKRAGIGVAMGQKGTDVAREAADMVLLDDNFATIVSAVREGRRIYDNIRKFIRYTLTSNAGEIWTLFLAPFVGLPIPLLPIHILWINLITDGLPGLAYAAEPAEPGSMRRPPRPPDENIFAGGLWQQVLWIGLLIGGLSLATAAWALGRGLEHWQTMVFTVLTLAQLFNALAVRSERRSLWRLGLLGNLPMLGALVVTLGLQLAAVYLPWCNALLHTQPLPVADLALCVAVAALVLPATELEKWLIRKGWLYRPAGSRVR